MNIIFRAALSTAIATLACANVAAGAIQLLPITTISRLGSVKTEFSCGASIFAACNYLLLKSVCQEKLLDNGVKERTCVYMEAAPAFQLRAGETKTITNLPVDFLYTMKVGAMPTPQECINAPIPH